LEYQLATNREVGMALDYFLEMEGCGTRDQKDELREFLITKFKLHEYQGSGILGADGLNVTITLGGEDDAQELCTSKVKLLSIAFRINKFESEKGYRLLQSIALTVFERLDSDFSLYDQEAYILLRRKSSVMFKTSRDDQLWRCWDLKVPIQRE